MKINYLIVLVLSVFVTYSGSSVSLADYVIDNFQNTSITASPDKATVSTSTTGAMLLSRLASGAEGYEIRFPTTGVAAATASIEYSFTNGLRSLFPSSLGSGSIAAPVKFYVPIFLKNVTEGTFTVSVSQFFNSGTETTNVVPTSTSNSMIEIDTERTLGELGTDDLSSIRFDFTYSSGNFIGASPQTMIFGGGTGVDPKGRVGSFTVVPEPTSAAMIGCILAGFIARRRRKA